MNSTRFFRGSIYFERTNNAMRCLQLISSLERKSSSLVTPARVLAEADSPHVAVNKNNEHASEKQTVLQKRFAMLLCYHGKHYYGMQYNAHCPSIEKELFDALVKSGIHTRTDTKNPRYHLGFNRASRTDSGVSALRQVVSMNLPLDTDVEKINQFLPPDIRILGIKRTTSGFDAQRRCQSRSYCYVMPTFALCHFLKMPDPCENYRVDADTLLKASQIFQRFEGSHRFHNYTEKRDYWDQRSIRRIDQTSISNPFFMGNMEMVEFHVKGHSFMLHQIRRMIGMTIAIMRERFPFYTLQESLVSTMMPTPTAPSLGLMLEKQYFNNYNEVESRESLEWNEFDQDVEKFKMEWIVPSIAEEELNERSMQCFLNDKLKKHSLKGNSASSKLIEIGNYDIEEIENAITK